MESLVVLLFNMASSEISPMVYYRNIVEVLASTTDRLSINRQSIVDIIFIVPIMEVESGLFHIAGLKVTYFSRYFIQADHKVKENKSKFYFDQYTVEPLTHCLFSSLSYFAHNLRRAMYYLRESDISPNFFQIFFSMESFLYLCHKVLKATKASIIQISVPFYTTITCKWNQEVVLLRRITFI
jgi:hypothetical protein